MSGTQALVVKRYHLVRARNGVDRNQCRRWQEVHITATYKWMQPTHETTDRSESAASRPIIARDNCIYVCIMVMSFF